MTFKANVKGNINVKRRIIVNGREYSSVEEMPRDLRRAYEQAMTNVNREGDAIDPTAPRTTITFNGQEYGTVDEMPEDIRRLYNAGMMTVEAHGSIVVGLAKTREPGPAPLGPAGMTGAGLPSMAPIEVGGGSISPAARAITAGIVILMLLGALYYLSRLLLFR